ncbi:MAG: DMT family transporter [Candidatus Krumholzibacteriia bacterium]
MAQGAAQAGRGRAAVWGGFLFLTLVWGASFLWIKIAVEDVGPYVLVALRLVLGLAGLTAILAIQRPRLPRDRRTWLALAILGVTNTSLPWFLISWAEQSIDSALATVLNGTVPLMTIVLAHVMLRDDRMTIPRILGLLIGFTGVTVLARRGADGNAAGSLMGQGGMLLAAALYAFSAVYARRSLRHVTPLVQAFYSMLIATAIMWAALPLFGVELVMPSRPVVWVALVWLGVFGAGIASWILYYLLHAVGPTRTSLVTYMIPVVGVTLGVVVLKELLDFHLVAGTILIVSGVWVVTRR